MIALVILRMVSFLPLCIARSVGRGLGAVMRIVRQILQDNQLNLALCYHSILNSRLKNSPKAGCYIWDRRYLKPQGCGANQRIGYMQNRCSGGREPSPSCPWHDRGTILLVPHQGNWK